MRPSSNGDGLGPRIRYWPLRRAPWHFRLFLVGLVLGAAAFVLLWVNGDASLVVSVLGLAFVSAAMMLQNRER